MRYEHTVMVTPKSIMEELKNVEQEGWEVFQVDDITPDKIDNAAPEPQQEWRIWYRKPYLDRNVPETSMTIHDSVRDILIELTDTLGYKDNPKNAEAFHKALTALVELI